MRLALLSLPLLLAATPALAQQPPKVPPELTDPRTAERLSQMTQALGKALMNLPVGELEAIAEGRQPSAADRRRTVRDSDPNLEQQLAQAGPAMQSSMKALSSALPAIMQSLQQAGDALERATVNMPSPTYPKR